MAVTLELSVVNTQKPQMPAQVINIGEGGATIGRGAGNTCVLEDAKRFISSRHAQIDYFQGSFFFTDTSTNGCWLKEADEAIGKGNRVKLDNSTAVIIGPYELHFLLKEDKKPAVTVSAVQAGQGSDNSRDEDLLRDNEPDPVQQILNGVNPFAEATSAEGDDVIAPLEQAFTSAPFTGPDLNGQSEVPLAEVPLSDGADNALDGYFKPDKVAVEKIPTDWDFNEAVSPPTDQQTFAPAVEPDNSSNKQQEMAEVNVGQKPVDHAPDLSANISGENPLKGGVDRFDAVAALSRQLGLALPPELLQNPEPFIDDIADVVNEAMAGIINLINGRAVFKQSSRLAMTTIQPKSNNPLKFSVDKQDALEHLFTRRKPAYLGAKAAVNQAITDLQIHEMAFVAGLQAALQQVLQTLSPQQIEKTAAASPNKLRSLLSAPKYWQQYKSSHEQLERKITENLNEFLGQDFARAYEQQVLKLNQEHQESSK
ncbi:type VI secretion system-associated FHA domain protein TagH [Thalassomonas haliotis]|uniref:Type VI secretion system-associated FHA domain protein TagH n=1 Tax=Thalassomonas haliotis TaxID=485448 RepID=A0ABY7V8C9_9GAMM|nr:type VI secretion system-associated FHA domain protein TagH [Thalassomonas haliotis]WDE09505.1 type VI secretion system-associated FHA domain protein TagH [Thalassomonas haliotis]